MFVNKGKVNTSIFFYDTSSEISIKKYSMQYGNLPILDKPSPIPYFHQFSKSWMPSLWTGSRTMVLGMTKLIDALWLTKSTHSTKGALGKRTFILHWTMKHLKKLIIALLLRCYFKVHIWNSHYYCQQCSS